MSTSTIEDFIEVSLVHTNGIDPAIPLTPGDNTANSSLLTDCDDTFIIRVANIDDTQSVSPVVEVVNNTDGTRRIFSVVISVGQHVDLSCNKRGTYRIKVSMNDELGDALDPVFYNVKVLGPCVCCVTLDPPVQYLKCYGDKKGTLRAQVFECSSELDISCDNCGSGDCATGNCGGSGSGTPGGTGNCTAGGCILFNAANSCCRTGCNAPSSCGCDPDSNGDENNQCDNICDGWCGDGVTSTVLYRWTRDNIVINPTTGRPMPTTTIPEDEWTEVSTAQNLCAGRYTVFAKQVCQLDETTVKETTPVSASTTIFEPRPLAATIVPIKTHLSCSGDSDGAVRVWVTGGTSPYLYTLVKKDREYCGSDRDHGKVIRNKVSDEIFRNLSAGEYKVMVTDKNCCEQCIDFTVTQPPEMNVSISVSSHRKHVTLCAKVRNEESHCNCTYEWRNKKHPSTVIGTDRCVDVSKDGVYQVKVTCGSSFKIAEIEVDNTPCSTV